MVSPYIIRTAESEKDVHNLFELYNTVFYPENVYLFAETIFRHFPGMEMRYLFLAEDPKRDQTVSGLVLIPERWNIRGISLRVAEMAMVATREEDRGRGLIHQLASEYDATVMEEPFDLAVIQGIPGFYHKFGYHYAVPMESHINIPLHQIPKRCDSGIYTIRKAEIEDISFFLCKDEEYKDAFCLSSHRDENIWNYLLTHSKKTDYGSDFWIITNTQTGTTGYFRISLQGFGSGLIISEISEGVGPEIFIAILSFCKNKAEEQNKPYIRLNMHPDSEAGTLASAMNISCTNPYAWQIKIPDRLRFIKTIGPLLETRLQKSIFHQFNETIRLDLYTEKIDLLWKKGTLTSVIQGGEEKCSHTFCIPCDLFPALILGYRTWKELQYIRPDIAPSDQYTGSYIGTTHDTTSYIIDTLFPSCISWIYGQY